jgi:hypothetical protein
MPMYGPAEAIDPAAAIIETTRSERMATWSSNVRATSQPGVIWQAT